MRTINLEELTESGRVHNLSGRLRGLAAREHFALDSVDGQGEEAEFVVPDYIYSLTPSFVQGLLGGSVRAVNNDMSRFRAQYHFRAPAVVLQQIERGISAILTDRDISHLL